MGALLASQSLTPPSSASRPREASLRVPPAGHRAHRRTATDRPPAQPAHPHTALIAGQPLCSDSRAASWATSRAGQCPRFATELVLAITGAGRVKFMRVLEDAHRRQVLRQAGAVYQSAELQEHLAKIHRQRTRPEASA